MLNKETKFRLSNMLCKGVSIVGSMSFILICCLIYSLSKIPPLIASVLLSSYPNLLRFFEISYYFFLHKKLKFILKPIMPIIDSIFIKIRNLCDKIKNKISTSRSISIRNRLSETLYLTEFDGTHPSYTQYTTIPSYNYALKNLSTNNNNPPEYGRIFAQDGDVEIVLLENSCNKDNITALQNSNYIEKTNKSTSKTRDF